MATKETKTPETIVYAFDGVDCECTVTKDHNGEYVIQVIEGELEGRFVKLPADHKF